MTPQAGNRHPSARPKRKQPDSRTKFDVWLESQLEEGQNISVLFKLNPCSEGSAIANEMWRFECTVITVDRYHLFLDFGTAGQHWVSKENIISCH